MSGTPAKRTAVRAAQRLRLRKAADSRANRPAVTRSVAAWIAVAGTIIGSAITGFATYDAGYRAAEAQHTLVTEARAKELRDRRVEVYPSFLDAARKVSTVAQAVYEQCPYDFTPSGCDGDRKEIDQALREYFRTRGDIMVWGSKRANDKADAVTNTLPNADLLPCLRLKPTSVGLTARMCLPSSTGESSFIWVERRPSGELVNENGEVVVAKQQPRAAEFEAAVREFQVVMSCDVSPQPANSC